LASEVRLPGHMTIAEARDWLRPRTEHEHGVQCPVCGQHAQAYKRSVTMPMVKVMVRMRMKAIKQADDYTAWVKLSEVEQESRDSTMLAYWDLIREHGEKRGWWQITANGEDFLNGKLTIERYAHVYRGKVYAHTGPHVRVTDVYPKFELKAVHPDLPEQTQMEE